MAEETTTQYYQRQAPFIEDFQKRAMEAAFARGETPVDIPGIQVAGMDPLTRQAMQRGHGIGQYQNWLGTGAGTLGTALASMQSRGYNVPGMYDTAGGTLGGVPARFNQAAQAAQLSGGAYRPTDAAAFMDPYQQEVTRDALAEMQRQGDIQRNQLRGQAVQSGAFGGSRQGLMESELNRNLADMQSRRIFEDRSRNFNQAQNAAQTAFENQQRRQQGIGGLLQNLGVGTTGLGMAQRDLASARCEEAVRMGTGITGIGTAQMNLAPLGQNILAQQAQVQSQLGALGQTQSQRELDAARQGTLQQAYEPFNRISFMSDILKPNIGSTTSSWGSKFEPSASPLSQAIGAGIGMYGINRGMNNPFANWFSGGASQ